MRRSPLAAAIGFSFSLATASAAAAPAADNATDGPREHERQLEEVAVTASPLDAAGGEIVQPASVIAGAELEDRRAATIGETVAQTPGVQSSNFGPGVGRPIIRGLEGARVQVLEGGVASLDVSTVSADHAVGIEPFLADQVEVLKGPSTLLYGAGAIGGVVNVVDGRIPETANEGFAGRAEVRGNSVSDERTGMVRIDASNERFGFHADALRRRTDDFETPANDSGLLENSAIETDAAALGFSGFGSFGFGGIAVSTYETLYGIPLGAHEHEDGEEHVDGDEGEGEVVRLDLDQTRVDGKLVLDAPFANVERILLRAGHNDYTHVELEGDEVGTRFENRAWDARGELVHAPLAGFRGAVGVQVGRRDFSAIGEEAFVPPSETQDFGVFVVEQGDFEPFRVEVGARFDQQDVETSDGREGDFSAVSLSAGGIWDFAEHWHASVNLDRAQRAPSSEELFSNGPHIATQSIEIGDEALVEETANQFEVGLHFHSDRWEWNVSAYRNAFDDFIYLADTGEFGEEDLPIRRWTQADATFRGFEAEAELTLAENAGGSWKLRVFGDSVRAKLDGGTDLPRIAPARVGARVSWERDGWRANLGAIRHARQDDVAPGETATDGYTLVNAHLSYGFSVASAEWEVFLDGTNLTDEEARVHTSFLKDIAPLPGRGIAFGLRSYF